MSAIVVAGITRHTRMIAAALLAASVAGCGGFRTPAAEDLIPNAPKFELKTLPTSPVQKLGPPTLVGADGNCAAAAHQSEFSNAGIVLRMSECDVVQRAGPPEHIDISATPAGDRVALMTYGGDRAGIYRFVGGRLVSVERTAEPAPAPERPAKKRAAKKSAGATPE